MWPLTIRGSGDACTWTAILQVDSLLLASPSRSAHLQLSKPQVMQDTFTLTDGFYGKSASARKSLLTALRNAAQLRKRYVVKGTNEPGRTLFAEYVLNTIGRAKIPKSLVLEIDPSRPHTHADPSEGMIMLNLIDTRRSPGRMQRATTPHTPICTMVRSPVVDYLVVQKLLAGDMLADPEELMVG